MLTAVMRIRSHWQYAFQAMHIIPHFSDLHLHQQRLEALPHELIVSVGFSRASVPSHIDYSDHIHLFVKQPVAQDDISAKYRSVHPSILINPFLHATDKYINVHVYITSTVFMTNPLDQSERYAIHPVIHTVAL
jgi:hypothetical protein